MAFPPEAQCLVSVLQVLAVFWLLVGVVAIVYAAALPRPLPGIR